MSKYKESEAGKGSQYRYSVEGDEKRRANKFFENCEFERKKRERQEQQQSSQ